MAGKIIYEDGETIAVRDTYQTHWNPDRIGGSLSITDKAAAKSYNEKVAELIAKRIKQGKQG